MNQLENGAFFEDYDLNSREIEILRSISQDGDTVVAFQGLKRKLGLHQETLARGLSRLQRDGLIEKSSEGYRMSKKANIQLSDAQPSIVLPIIRSYLPFSINLQSFINTLRGSWFGRLRWLGYSNNSETLLTWITDDGSVQVELKIADAAITVQARVRESADVREAVIAAHELYSHISSIYTKQLKQNGMFLPITNAVS